MKVGDRVYHKDTLMGGKITSIEDCTKCGVLSISFCPPDSKVKFYYHSTNFEIIEEAPNDPDL